MCVGAHQIFNTYATCFWVAQEACPSYLSGMMDGHGKVRFSLKLEESLLIISTNGTVPEGCILTVLKATLFEILSNKFFFLL